MIEPANYTFNIRNTEIDLHNRLSFTALANILQECASRHATALGVSTLDLMQTGRTWVLSKLKISMHETAKLGEQLTVRTWPGGAQGVRALRGFRMFDQSAQQLGTAESVWLILDMAQRKVVAIPDEVARLRVQAEPLAYKFKKTIPEVPQGTFEYRTSVAWHDLDINRHVNNNHYIRWIVDSFPFDFLNAHTLATAELVFLGESYYGDQIHVHTFHQGETSFIHEIRNDKSTVLVRAVTGWVRV
jgi:acyl-ACP thioesterase